MAASCMNAGESSTMKWVLLGLFGVSCRFISRTMRRASVSISPSRNAAICALMSNLIVSYFLQGSDQERYNGKSQENQMVGLMDLDGQMCGMQVKKIAGYKIILRD